MVVPQVAKSGRTQSYGEGYKLSPVDRFGVWLSARRIRGVCGPFAGLAVGDIGCGYQAQFSRSILGEVKSLLLVDVSVADDLKLDDRIKVIEGFLPAALAGLPDQSLDVLLCNSVLEHLDEPQKTLGEFFRLVRPTGKVFVNVPSWRGKWFLELAAFRLGLAPVDEIDDHKMYYDPSDLWPMLVKAGFRPRLMKVARHKFGLNTYAFCRRSDADGLRKVS